MNAIDKKSASLTAKLLAINVPMVSIVLLAVFLVLELQYYRTERAALVHSLHSLVDLQSSAFTGAAWEYDIDRIAVLLDELTDLPQLQSAVVLDDSAAILGRIGDFNAKPEAPDLMVEQPLVYESDQSSVTVGALVVTFHSGVIWKNVENHLKVNALTLFVLLATLIGVTLIAVRVVIGKPIGRLLNSIERMRSDHVLELVDWQSADELGRVVDAYNEMQTKQAEAEAALIEHQNHLEAEVAARTADLATKEAQLRIAMDNMPGGMFMLDAESNFVLVNQQYQELFDFPDGIVGEGCTLHDAVRFRAERGDYGPGDPEDLIERRLRGYSDREVLRHEERLPGGKIVELIRRPAEDGSTVGIATDITERKRAEDALEEIKERFTLATEAANVGLWDANVLTGKSYYSDKWMTMLGYEPNELPRSVETWENLLHPEDKLRAKTTFERNIADNDPTTIYQTEFRLRAKDGSYRWISSAGNIIEQDDEGCARRLAGIHVDVTDRKVAEEELTEARDAAESATVAKAAFLATMSHEIRTPMNGVVGMVDLLRQTKLDDDQYQMTRTIRDSAHALLTVINDILDFSKIEAGKLDLEGIPISVRDALEGVAETLAPNARAKGIGLKIYVDPDLPDAVLGDQVRIRQFLFNLGGNAIKFTEAGRVLMRVDLVELREETKGEKAATIRFSIIDSGIGISEEARANLFSAFSQAESSTTRRFGGTGLGLTICKRLTDLMGGSIDVQSEPGKGSTFSITLTLPVPEDHAIKSDGHDLEGLKVLLLGDDAEVCELHARYLRHWNAEVTTCGELERAQPWAVEAAKEGNPFKVIVLGSGWPLETQAAHVGAIQAAEALAGTRFVLMTRTRIKAERKDIADTVYVESDPLRRAAFIHGVAVAAGRASPDISYDEDEIVVESAKAPTIEAATAAGTLILVAEDNVINQDIMRRQLNMLGYAAEFTDDGKQALAAWRRKHYAMLLTDCHMPEMDGFELTEAIRKAEMEGDGHLPIIAITASVLEAEVARCIEVGMDDFLAKPLELPKLKATLRKWMPATPVAITAAAEGVGEDAQAAALAGAAAVDPAALEPLTGGDREVFKEILDEFVDPARSIAGEIEAAYEERSAAGVGAGAHKFRSAAQTIGANSLADLCLALERAGKAGNWEEIDALAPRLDGELLQVFDYIAAL